MAEGQASIDNIEKDPKGWVTGSEEVPENLTRAEASELITELKAKNE